MAAHATLRRAVGLLNDFRYEQSDPARFYGALAADTRRLVGAFAPLDGAVYVAYGGSRPEGSAGNGRMTTERLYFTFVLAKSYAGATWAHLDLDRIDDT